MKKKKNQGIVSPQYQFVERWSPVNHGMFKGGFVIVLRKFPKEVSEVLESCGMRLETLKEGHSPECNFWRRNFPMAFGKHF